MIYPDVPAVFSKIHTLQSQILAVQLQGNWLKLKTSTETKDSSAKNVACSSRVHYVQIMFLLKEL